MCEPPKRCKIKGSLRTKKVTQSGSHPRRLRPPFAPIRPRRTASPFRHTSTPAPSRENPSRGEAATTERRCHKPSNPHVEDLEESGGARLLDGSPILHGSPGDLDSLELVCTVADADTGRVEPSRVDAHERGGVLPVPGAAPVLAEETAGVEPAGEAERAAAAKSKALAPWTPGETRREVETLPREGKRVHEPPPEAPPRKREHEVDKPKPEALPRERECEHARTGAKRKPKVEASARKGEREHAKALPPEGNHERGTTPQGNTNEGECEPSWPPREPSREDVLSTWGGPDPWNPGGRPLRERIFESVEANKKDTATVLLLLMRGVVNVHHYLSVMAGNALLVGAWVISRWRMGRTAPEMHIRVLLSEPISQTGQGQKKYKG